MRRGWQALKVFVNVKGQVYQGILEVKRGEEDDLQALKVCVNVKGQVYQGILEVKRGEEDDLQALKVCANVKRQVYQVYALHIGVYLVHQV